jgi:DNA-binding PadR family transcriptional regulator
MTSNRAGPDVTPAAFQVLVAIAAGESHGYAVMRFVEQLTEGKVRLGAGTLYRTMARLMADGLVVETEHSDASAPHDARRRYYRLTRLGRRAAREEATMLWRLVSAAEAAGLVDRKPGEGRSR